MKAQPIEIQHGDTCIFFGCNKPVGRRGMCWMHLKQMQRSGDLLPPTPAPRAPCVRCQKRPARFVGKGRKSGKIGLYCQHCYNTRHKQAWRKEHPELYAEELKRGAQRMRKHRAKKLAESGIKVN